MNWLIRPSKRARDLFAAFGALLLVLAVIAFAGADFTFDEARAAWLRPLAMLLAGLGAVCCLRGSIASGGEQE